MKEIIEKTREFTRKELYQLTMSPEQVLLKNIKDGTVISAKDYIMYKDTKENGEETELLSFFGAADGGDVEVYVTQSKTFKRSFKDIFDLCDGDAFEVKKITGQSKNGRQYVDCVMV